MTDIVETPGRTRLPAAAASTRRSSTAGYTAGELLVLARGGDQRAWTELVSRYTRMVRGVAMRVGIGPEAASDVAQVIWIRLLERGENIRNPECVLGWLKTAAHREAIAVARRQPREARTDVAEEQSFGPSGEEGPEAYVVRADVSRRVSAALEVLPCPRRQLVSMVAQGHTYAEITAATGVPVPSIGPTWGRSLAALRRTPEIAALAN